MALFNLAISAPTVANMIKQSEAAVRRNTRQMSQANQRKESNGEGANFVAGGRDLCV